MKEYQINVIAGTKAIADIAKRVEDTTYDATMEIKPVVAGPLPDGPAGKEKKMILETPGTWTYKENSFVNPQGYIMKLWWDGIKWVLISIYMLPVTPVEDNRISTSTKSALSANQGRILDEKIESIPIVEVLDGFASNSQSKASSANNTFILNAIKINRSEKATPNGIATLGSNGKLTPNQIDISGLKYKGIWDASNNIPAVRNGTGSDGDFFIVGNGGIVDLGNGNITFKRYDNILYANGIWENNDNSNNLNSPISSEEVFQQVI